MNWVMIAMYVIGVITVFFALLPQNGFLKTMLFSVFFPVILIFSILDLFTLED